MKKGVLPQAVFSLFPTLLRQQLDVDDPSLYPLSSPPYSVLVSRPFICRRSLSTLRAGSLSSTHHELGSTSTSNHVSPSESISTFVSWGLGPDVLGNKVSSKGWPLRVQSFERRNRLPPHEVDEVGPEKILSGITGLVSSHKTRPQYECVGFGILSRECAVPSHSFSCRFDRRKKKSA